MSEYEPRWNLEDIAQGIACGYCGAYMCRCEHYESYDYDATDPVNNQQENER